MVSILCKIVVQANFHGACFSSVEGQGVGEDTETDYNIICSGNESRKKLVFRRDLKANMDLIYSFIEPLMR